STGTQRSSARLTVTLAQSRFSLASFSRNGTGLRPPDSTRQAWPLPAMAARRRSATSWARVAARVLASARSCTFTVSGSFSSDIPIPRPPVARYQCNRAHRAPRARRVWLGRITRIPPAGDQLVAPLPGILDFVLAHEQVLVAAHHFEQQALVGIRNPRAAPGVGKSQLQRATAQLHAIDQAQRLGHHP